MSGLPASRDAEPRSAVDAILEAFATHDLVFLGEAHGIVRQHEFRVALINDPRFSTVVNDIIVEFGNSRYQALMDRYVSGEDVPLQQLQHAWQDTTSSSPVFDAPIYADFFREVRRVNAGLPATRRLRVLLADAPINWAQVKSRDDIRRFGLQKDRNAATVMQTQVLARHRHGLAIFGDSHFMGRGIPSPPSLINLVEQAGARVFVIGSSQGSLLKVQPSAAEWPAPSVISVANTTVGDQPLAAFYPLPPAPGWADLKLADEVNALLYFGPARNNERSLISAEQCADRSYMRMRLGRLTLEGGPLGAPLHDWANGIVDTVKRRCAALGTSR
jgi:hypothetical protein